MTFIALLRGINVSGHNKLPMKELVTLLGGLGYADVRHYIQSGNLVFEADGDVAEIESTIERAIERIFQLTIQVIVRAADRWPGYVAGNPFLEACETRASQVMLALSKRPPKPGAVDGLRERAVSGERVQQVGDALWIDFAGAIVKSKLTPALFDRLAGSTVTARNWNTVLKLAALSGAATTSS